MKLAALSALLGACSAAQINRIAVQPTYESWCAQFGKCSNWGDVEHADRSAIYADNVQYMDAHNAKFAAGQVTFDMGVNEFSHMSHEEFKSYSVGPKMPARNNESNVVALPTLVKLTGTDDSVDWRTKGAVTPVKNQGQCGSCWSFSTTGSTEGRVQIATGKLTSLSEQQLMDCSKAEGNQGCQGGLMDDAFKYIVKNGGLDTESDYSYTAANGQCNAAKAAVHASSITSFNDVAEKDEDALATAVAAGPVSVAIEADQRAFQSYKSGTLSAMCGTKLDHGVLVVGMGEGYWIVKNSWGATWGMEGYIQLKRTGGKTAGECGIASQPSYPVAGKAPPTPPGPPTPPAPPSPPAPPAPAGGPYEDPNAGPCADGEQAVQITGIQGSFCSPKCEGLFVKKCPAYPGSITAKPTCVLETAGSQKPTQCALICDPSAADDACPAKASCKAIQTTGLCTYDN